MAVVYPKVPESAALAASNPGETPQLSDDKYIDGDSQHLLDDLRDFPNEEKFEEVVRILSWPKFAYYEILEVKEDVNDRGIKSQYRAKAALTHPDKNQDPQANEAFQR
jgi:DnaJ domain